MNEIFLGRNEEMQRFQNLLKSLVSSTSASQELPNIFLLSGFGGMGKTTLLQQFYKMSQEGDFQNCFNTLCLDWEKQREYNIGLQVEHDNIQPATVLKVIYQAIIEKEEWKDYFQNYIQNQTLLQTASEKIKQAEEEQEKINQPVPPILTKQEWEVYKNSEKRLAETLGEGITKIAQEKPLLIFFDTYEIVDRIECDDVLRNVIRQAGNKVIWVIAGRSNLADNIWRNEVAKKALSEALEDEEPDIVAVAIRSLGRLNALEIPQLVRFLNLNESKDRYVREAAARELGYMAQDIADIKKVKETVQPLINAMRNDYMKPVREAAIQSGLTIYFTLEHSDFIRENIGKKLKSTLILAGKLDLEEEELEETDPAILIQNLNSCDDINIKERIIRELGNLKVKEAVNPLVNLLKDANEDPEIRATAAAALGDIGIPTKNNDNAIQNLIKALEYNEDKKDNDSFVRLQAAKALGKLIPPVAIDALYQAIRLDKFSNVREAEKEALKNYIKDSTTSNQDRVKAFHYFKLTYRKDAEELLQEKELQKIDSELNRELGTIQQDNFDSRLVSELIDELNNNNKPDICVELANALGKLGDSSALKPLINQLKKLEEGDWIARQSVIRALGNLEISRKQLDETKLVEVILVNRWRNDAISNVRDSVENAIVNIYRKTSGYKPAEQALERYSSDKRLLERLKYEISSVKKN